MGSQKLSSGLITSHSHSNSKYAMISSGKVFIICYLIFSPAVLSFTVPAAIHDLFKSEEDVNRQGHFTQGQDRTIDVPDNVLEVAAVGFVAGLAGSLFSLSATTTTSTTTAATTTAT